MQISAKLRKGVDGNGDEFYTHWCPGCGHAHIYYVRERTPHWTFNGNVDKPSFTPSMLILDPGCEPTEHHKGWPRRTICHYFLTDGMIQFLSDSGHKLAGQTVELPDLPSEDDYGFSD